jgi:hypothetical protein
MWTTDRVMGWAALQRKHCVMMPENWMSLAR